MTYDNPPSSELNNNDILTDTGTNELEVLVFKLGESRFGINVAKVREIVVPPPVTPCPEQHPALLGVVDLRGQILPLISLHKFLNIKADKPENIVHPVVIVTEFNQVLSAFLVDGVDQIFRVSWNLIQLPPDIMDTEQVPLTGILRQQGKLVPLIDFESIRSSIGENSFQADAINNIPATVDRAQKIICIVEDSGFVRHTLETMLKRAGYGRIDAYTNGADAWKALQFSEEMNRMPDLIISDIEMPQMDGLTLTRLVRENENLSKRPVILFSSIITEDLRHKGETVGADDQIAKPQLSMLVEMVDHWLQVYDQKKLDAHNNAAA